MEKNNVYQKFMKAKADFHNTNMQKSGENKFSKFKYFELGDIIPVAIRCLTANGLVSTTNFTKETATLSIIDTESGGNIDFSLDLTEAVLDLKGSQAIQGLGAKITYIRRYLLQIAFDIIEQDVIDSTSGKPVKDLVQTGEEKTDLRNTLNEIEGICTDLAKTKRDEVVTTIKKHIASGNYNKIKDIETAKKLLTELNKLKA